MTLPLSRKTFLKGTGALVVGFCLSGGVLEPAQAAANTPPDAGQIDSWIVIHEDNTATILTGHQELGQGTSTGLLMIAGEELNLDMTQLRFATEDTDVTPASFPSNSSQGICGNGAQVRAASAAARAVLLERAAAQLGVPVAELTVTSGIVSAGGKSVRYGELLGGKVFDTAIPPAYNLKQSGMPGWSGSSGVAAGKPGTKSPADYTLVGKRVPRIDIPQKVTGAYTYVHDVRLPGMLHARWILPPGQRAYGAGAPVRTVNERSIAHIRGARVLRRGDVVGVVAAGEWDAIQAAKALEVTWADPPPMPTDVFAHMREQTAAGDAIYSRTVDTGNVEAALASAARTVSREYSWPYNSHAPIGPGCAVADVKPHSARIYSNSQDLWDLQERLATVLGLPKSAVRVSFVEGGGTYGGGPGRYEVPIAAAILSQLAGKPIRLQLERDQEIGWDNFSMPQTMQVRAGLDDGGKIVGLDYTITQLAFPILTYAVEQFVGEPYRTVQKWDPSTDVTGSQYTIPNWRLTSHTLPVWNSGYFKTGYLRSPIAIGASFAVEQAVDELAYLAKVDPVEFRRRNVQVADTHPQANFKWLGLFDYSHVISNRDRWLAVLDAVADAANWRPGVAASALSDDDVVRGRGVALAGCGNGAYAVQYCAAVAEIEVHKKTGAIVVKRVYTAQDYGLAINPDLIENQAIGMVTMATSRLLKEELAFDNASVTSRDFKTYPILRFTEAPKVTHTIISRPEITSGPASEELMPPAIAAIANAFFDATGVRMTSAPFTPRRVLEALRSAS